MRWSTERSSAAAAATSGRRARPGPGFADIDRPARRRNLTCKAPIAVRSGLCRECEISVDPVRADVHDADAQAVAGLDDALLIAIVDAAVDVDPAKAPAGTPVMVKAVGRRGSGGESGNAERAGGDQTKCKLTKHLHSPVWRKGPLLCPCISVEPKRGCVHAGRGESCFRSVSSVAEHCAAVLFSAPRDSAQPSPLSARSSSRADRPAPALRPRPGAATIRPRHAMTSCRSALWQCASHLHLRSPRAAYAP